MHKNPLEKDLDAALGKLQLKHNFKFTCTQSQDFGITVKIHTLESQELIKKEFDVLATRAGVDPDLFGAEFKNGRTTYKVVGFKGAARKNCLRIQVIQGQSIGKQFTCSPAFVGTSRRLEKVTL
jgi:hypothetical protein